MGSRSGGCLILGRFIRAYEGKPVEATLTLAMGRLQSGLGSIAGMGILLTGLGLIWQDHYGLLESVAHLHPHGYSLSRWSTSFMMGVVGSQIVPRTARSSSS